MVLWSRVPMNNVATLSKFTRIADYLSVAQIFLRDNFLLEKPLTRDHIKPRLLGHWGTCPGINLVYAHTNRLIISNPEKDFLYIVGPGHGFPAFHANLFLEGSLTKVSPQRLPYTRTGLEELCREFSTPYGFPSHLNPEAPGVVLEGGELGYSLSVAYGTVLDNPNLVTVCLVGDGEAETGPLAAAWNANRFINPANDGAVLPVLHLNGYKISAPTVFGRMGDKEVEGFFMAHGYDPILVDAKDHEDAHRQLSDAFDRAYIRIEDIQERARGGEQVVAPRWPMIIMRTPKGMGGLSELDGEKVTGNHLSHQVVFKNLHSNKGHVEKLEEWLRSYRVQELLQSDKSGRLIIDADVRSLIPKIERTLGMSPHANGGVSEIVLPDVSSSFCNFEKKACLTADSMETAGTYLARVQKQNETRKNFRLFSPDETYSNHLHPIFKQTARSWQWPIEAWDKDLSPKGRVVELLSEHTLFGMLWGYTITGRHGIFASYEAFVQIIASMADQYVKFVKLAQRAEFRKPVPALNIILSSLLERQDHNGFSHQNPSFIASMLDRDLENVNLYFPADKNLMLYATHKSLSSRNAVNVLVCGKRMKRNWLSPQEAQRQVKEGIMVWDFLSDDNPDVVVVTCGDYITEEAAIGVKLFRQYCPDVRVRFVNIFQLDLLADKTATDYARSAILQCLTEDKGIVFNFHGYPATIKKLLFDYHLSERIIINGYEEEGSTTSPFDMLSRSGLSRFHLVKDLAAMALKQNMISAAAFDSVISAMDEKLEWEREYIKKHDVDPDEIHNWEL